MKKTLPIFFVLISTLSAFAQAPDTLWTQTYDLGEFDLTTDFQETDDGGYIIAGITNNDSTLNTDVFLIKTDGFGDTLWTNTISSEFSLYGMSVKNIKNRFIKIFVDKSTKIEL